MSITKAHLADSIHNQLGLPQNKSVQSLESILEIMPIRLLQKTRLSEERRLVMNKDTPNTEEQQSVNRNKAIKNVMSTFKTMYAFIDRFVEQKSAEKSQ